jgi:hypothetical protein
MAGNAQNTNPESINKIPVFNLQNPPQPQTSESVQNPTTQPINIPNPTQIPNLVANVPPKPWSPNSGVIRPVAPNTNQLNK